METAPNSWDRLWLAVTFAEAGEPVMAQAFLEEEEEGRSGGDGVTEEG